MATSTMDSLDGIELVLNLVHVQVATCSFNCWQATV